MAYKDPQELLKEETRVTYGQTPRELTRGALPEGLWELAGDEFLLRDGAGHYFYYKKGEGVTIERGEGADTTTEDLWLSGSVYSAVASINGFLPIHASAVCHDGGVYAFTGPAGAGKSTLVTALGNRGLALFCDDTLVLDLSDPDAIWCQPGHKRLKLAEDSLSLTGAVREEKVAIDIEKFYAKPVSEYSGGPLPLQQLIFLEEGPDAVIEAVTGAERLMRLQDDHYTALHFAAARQFTAETQFQHLARMARQIATSRFSRPHDITRFNDGVSAAYRYIVQG